MLESESENVSSLRLQRRTVFVAIFALTALLVFFIFPERTRLVINEQVRTVYMPQYSSTTTVLSGSGGPRHSSTVQRNSSQRDILTPPPQEWAQEQFVNTLSLLHQHYNDVNTWQACGAKTYYFQNIKTIFTGVPKTGCSNWIEALLRANGDLTRDLDPTMVRKVHGGISGKHRIPHLGENVDLDRLREAFSFTVVRNPWTRLVSGYRDKVSDENTQGGSFRRVGKDIVREMRNVTDRDELDKLYPTFTEFAEWLVRHNGTGNSHFHQQYKTLCLPSVRYDFIVPLEYAAVLNREVWGRINAKTKLLGSYDKSSDPRKQKSTLYAKEWLSQINQETIDELYKIFKLDFALMKYSNFTDPNFPLPLYQNQSN